MPNPAMLPASLALLLGLGIQAAVLWGIPDGMLPSEATSALGFVSAGLLVYGCAVVAVRKKYSPWFGMAGLLSAIGVGFILLLPGVDAFPTPWRRIRRPRFTPRGGTPYVPRALLEQEARAATPKESAGKEKSER